MYIHGVHLSVFGNLFSILWNRRRGRNLIPCGKEIAYPIPMWN